MNQYPPLHRVAFLRERPDNRSDLTHDNYIQEEECHACKR